MMRCSKIGTLKRKWNPCRSLSGYGESAQRTAAQKEKKAMQVKTILRKTPLGYEEHLVVEGALLDLRDLERTNAMRIAMESFQKRRPLTLTIHLASAEFASSSAKR